MKKLYTFLLVCALFSTSFLHAQITCTPGGNLWVYTNYDGGVLNLNVDINVPNIKIGVCTYEPVTINISGAFVGNVTEVRYAGYVSTNNMHCPNSPTTTTINGVPSGITSINFLPPGVLANPNGNSSIVCAYSCNITSNQGGCNTADQIKAYFQTSTGGTLVSYGTQYGCFPTTPFLLSAGGNCCSAVTSCLIAANAGNDVQMCAGGSVTLNGSATGGATVYSWSPTAGLSNPNSATTNASPTTTTTYVLTAGDGANCSDVDTVVVTVNPLPTVNLGADIVSCGSSTLLDAGAQPNSTFLWNNASTSQTLNVTSGGTYYVTVTNAAGCVSADTIAVTFNTPPTVDLGNDTSICGDNLPLNAGNPGMTYLWSNSSTQQSIVAFQTGTYSVVVTDANGCTGTDAINITFNMIPVVNFISPLPIVCLSDGMVTLTTGSPAGGTYSGTGVTAGNFDPSAAGIGTYAITYTFTDSAGCTGSASDSIAVDACLGTGGVSAFTVTLSPNPSQGIFQLYVSETCTVELINSLGQTVETSTAIPGNNSIGNTELAEGVYVVRLTNAKQQQQTARVVIKK